MGLGCHSYSAAFKLVSDCKMASIAMEGSSIAEFGKSRIMQVKKRLAEASLILAKSRAR
jgi:hypothetical protein